MRWFEKEKQPDVWDVADDQPLGDIDAAHKIRDICASAGTIAEKLVAAAGAMASRSRPPTPSDTRPRSSARSKSRCRSPTIRCVTFQ